MNSKSLIKLIEKAKRESAQVQSEPESSLTKTDG